MADNKNTLKNLGQKVALGAVTCALALAPALPAFAANGLQDSATDPDQQTYSADAGSWSGGDHHNDGKVHLEYITDGGWYDPGDDPTKPGSDEGQTGTAGDDTDSKHDAGTFQVVIPTYIKYSGMKVGTVSTSDDYEVTVRGAIPSDKKVVLTAETGNAVSNGSDSFTETTTQGKTEWTYADAFGSVNEDNSLAGTTTTDNIKMSGTAKSSGTYTGTVGYTATLEDVS